MVGTVGVSSGLKAGYLIKKKEEFSTHELTPLQLRLYAYSEGDRPVDQIEVKIIKTQSLQRGLNTSLDIFGTVVSVPQLKIQKS